MPSQTRDLEYAISTALRAANAPMALGDLLAQFSYLDDPRWIGVALVHLRRDAEIRWTGCDPQHNHGAECTVEIAP